MRDNNGRSDLADFDVSVCQNDNQAMADLITDAINNSDSEVLVRALTSARISRGASEASDAITQGDKGADEHLSLENPLGFYTVVRVLAELGFRLVVVPA